MQDNVARSPDGSHSVEILEGSGDYTERGDALTVTWSSLRLCSLTLSPKTMNLISWEHVVSVSTTKTFAHTYPYIACLHSLVAVGFLMACNFKSMVVSKIVKCSSHGPHIIVEFGEGPRSLYARVYEPVSRIFRVDEHGATDAMLQSLLYRDQCQCGQVRSPASNSRSPSGPACRHVVRFAG